MRSITLIHPAVSSWCRKKSAGQTHVGIVQLVGGSSPWCIPKSSGTFWPLESHSESDALQLLEMIFSNTSVGFHSKFQIFPLWNFDFFSEDSVTPCFSLCVWMAFVWFDNQYSNSPALNSHHLMSQYCDVQSSQGTQTVWNSMCSRNDTFHL